MQHKKVEIMKKNSPPKTSNKEPTSYSLSPESIAFVKVKGKAEGRSASEWLERHLRALMAKK